MRYWKSKFARFVRSYGATVLASRMELHNTSVYQWISGRTVPRPSHAEVILQLARERGSRLTMNDIYEHARTVRADDIKPDLVAAHRPAAVFPIAPSLRG
jgi:DNA-binding transcriptional regulator YdaS (Cro superfamily)